MTNARGIHPSIFMDCSPLRTVLRECSTAASFVPRRRNACRGLVGSKAMRRVVYSVAVSLDGFIAGPKGEADWIVMDPDIDFGALFGRFDTILMGRKSYDLVRAAGEARSMPGMEVYVCSHTLKLEEVEQATLVDNPMRLIPDLK